MNRGGQRRQRRVNLHYEASDDDASMIIERVVRCQEERERERDRGALFVLPIQLWTVCVMLCWNT